MFPDFCNRRQPISCFGYYLDAIRLDQSGFFQSVFQPCPYNCVIVCNNCIVFLLAHGSLSIR